MSRFAVARAALSLAVGLAALVWTTPTSVSAQAALGTGGMDLHLFRPAVDSKGHFSVNGTDILGHLDFSFGLLVDGGFGMLPFEGFANDESRQAADAEYCGGRSNLLCGRVVDGMVTGTAHFNLGLGNLAVVGVQLPVAFAFGSNMTIPEAGGFGGYNAAQRGLDYQGLGNITVHSKFRLLRAERNSGWGLAAILQLEIPTGAPDQFVGDPIFVLWPRVIGEWRPDRRIRFNLDVGFRAIFGEGAVFPVGGRTTPMGLNATMPIIDPAQPGAAFQYGHNITFGLGASFRLGDAPVDLVLETYGAQFVDAFGTQGGFNLEALGGIKLFVERNSYFVISGGGGLPVGGAVQADVRGMVGFIFEPSIGDRDGDGIRDDVDQCPDEPEDFDGFQDEDGCPDPDNDRDGIPDVDDACPNVPEDRDGIEDEDGCPEGNEGDRDGDGIPDHLDQCPDDPEDRDGFQDEDGCPDPDNDGDGILDVDDLCPNDPEDFDGFQDADGCPDPDNDGDRILDVDDQCPDDPETYNGLEDEDGCPDSGSVILEGDSIIILEKIYFETDSAAIQPRSFPIVDAVAATLVGNPHITLVEIQGHADERSSDEYNIRLTRDRAAAVLEAMVQRGVARERLRSAGYGERCPVDPRSTPAAWERNRRVEFKIIRTVDGPTGVDVACPAGRDLIPR